METYWESLAVIGCSCWTSFRTCQCSWATLTQRRLAWLLFPLSRECSAPWICKKNISSGWKSNQAGCSETLSWSSIALAHSWSHLTSQRLGASLGTLRSHDSGYEGFLKRILCFGVRKSHSCSAGQMPRWLTLKEKWFWNWFGEEDLLSSEVCLWRLSWTKLGASLELTQGQGGQDLLRVLQMTHPSFSLEIDQAYGRYPSS